LSEIQIFLLGQSIGELGGWADIVKTVNQLYDVRLVNIIRLFPPILWILH